MIIPAFLFLTFFASCNSREQDEMTDNTSTVDTGKVKAPSYIPPNTNVSSIGDTNRKRKFYIR